MGTVWAMGVGTTAAVDTTDVRAAVLELDTAGTAGTEEALVVLTVPTLLMLPALLARLALLATGVLAGALGVGCPVFHCISQVSPGCAQVLDRKNWQHTDEVTSHGRVGGRAAGKADFGVIGPLVEDLMAPSVYMGGGTSEEGRSHE